MKLIVGFSRPKKFMIGSILIRAFERADFSHAYIRWTARTLGEDMVYQASHGMVHFTSGRRFDSEAITVKSYEFEISDDQMRAITKKAVQLAGTKYGFMQLIGMALERLTGIRSPFRDGSRSYVCSELVCELIRQAPVYPIGLDPELSGPRDLQRAIEAVYNLERRK